MVPSTIPSDMPSLAPSDSAMPTSTPTTTTTTAAPTKSPIPSPSPSTVHCNKGKSTHTDTQTLSHIHTHLIMVFVGRKGKTIKEFVARFSIVFRKCGIKIRAVDSALSGSCQSAIRENHIAGFCVIRCTGPVRASCCFGRPFKTVHHARTPARTRPERGSGSSS